MAKKTQKPIGYRAGEVGGKILYHLFNIPTFKKQYKEIKKMVK